VPNAAVIFLQGSHAILIDEVGQRVVAVQTLDVLEEHQILAVRTVKSLHEVVGL
jgi:hypothetical protein